MKNTYDLYRCSALIWADLEFEDALHFRVEMARKAMKYYREKANKESNDEVIQHLIGLYEDSEDAVEWNRKFIQEIEEERRKVYGTKHSKRQAARLLSGERRTVSGTDSEISHQRILGSAWQWIKNRLGG